MGGGRQSPGSQALGWDCERRLRLRRLDCTPFLGPPLPPCSSIYAQNMLIKWGVFVAQDETPNIRLKLYEGPPNYGLVTPVKAYQDWWERWWMVLKSGVGHRTCPWTCQEKIGHFWYSKVKGLPSPQPQCACRWLIEVLYYFHSNEARITDAAV